jgi:hypothetical protein
MAGFKRLKPLPGKGERLAYGAASQSGSIFLNPVI